MLEIYLLKVKDILAKQSINDSEIAACYVNICLREYTFGRKIQTPALAGVTKTQIEKTQNTSSLRRQGSKINRRFYPVKIETLHCYFRCLWIFQMIKNFLLDVNNPENQ